MICLIKRKIKWMTVEIVDEEFDKNGKIYYFVQN